MTHPFWSLPGVTSHHMGGKGRGGGGCAVQPGRSEIKYFSIDLKYFALVFVLFVPCPCLLVQSNKVIID